MLSPKKFQQCVIQWQQHSGRHDLPWQLDITPYKVLVSELMLQQTQVTTVIPYYHNWLKRFPDFATLASASEDEILSAWQGLGYYSRARNLHKAAHFVTEHYAGQLPNEPRLLKEIPGVGPYTAGAITAFAFDRPGTIVDGNVKRLFSRLFKLKGNLNAGAGHKALWQLAERFTPAQNNRIFAQGLLDLGATVCKPKQPLCDQCPLQSHCQAFADDAVTEFPEKMKKKQIPTRTALFLWDFDEREGLLLEKRSDGSVWPKLWCLPQLEVEQEPTTKTREFGHFRHTFSHYKLEAHIITQAEPLLKGMQVERVPLQRLPKVGLPAPIRKFIELHLHNSSSTT